MSLWLVHASANKEWGGAYHQKVRLPFPNIHPTVPEIAFEVDRVARLQEVLLPADGELDPPFKAVLELLTFMKEMPGAFAPRRHDQEQSAESLIRETIR